MIMDIRYKVLYVIFCIFFIFISIVYSNIYLCIYNFGLKYIFVVFKCLLILVLVVWKFVLIDFICCIEMKKIFLYS